MGTGWRRAFCTTISRDGNKGTIKLGEKDIKQPPPHPSQRQQPESHSQPPSPSTRSVINRLNFFSGSRSGEGGGISSNSSTPRLQCRTTTNTPKKASSKSPLASNPSSPRSPLKLSLFRNSFRFRNNCGVCLQSVKTGQGTAIFTGECGHAFHFHCIAAHVKKQGKLICPVCSSEWKDVPLLATHTSQPEDDVVLSPKFSPEKVQAKHKHHSYNNDDELPIQNDTVSPKFIANRKIQIQPKHRHQSYKDDEPLKSPRFVPIPEVEPEDEDIEEFKGFFVNPVSSCSSIDPVDDRSKRDVDVRLIPESALISVGRGYKTYAIALKVKAPPARPAKNSKSAPLLDPSRRAPIDLVTVLDVSGSMSGAKMQMLKRAMRLVISSLSPADRLSIVVFSAFPKRLLPLRRMTADGQKAARKIVDRLACGQGTSVGDALREAAKVLEDRRERNPVASIMLLSDGQDEKVQSNDGQNNKRSGSGHVSSTRFGHVEISREPAEDAFAKCVGGLLSVVLQDTRIQLELAPGSAPAEIAGVYCCNGRPTLLDSGSVRLGDLYAEEERELLVELRVPFASVESKCTLSVKCSYKDPATQEMINGDNQVLFVPDLLAVRSSNPKIEELRNMFVTTRAVAEARRLVEHAEFTSAHHLLSSARALLMQSGLTSAEDCIRGLEAELMELARQRQQAEQQQQRRRTNEREAVMSNANASLDENGEPLTPTSAWRAAERLAKVASIKKSLNKVSDLHGFENARF